MFAAAGFVEAEPDLALNSMVQEGPLSAFVVGLAGAEIDRLGSLRMGADQNQTGQVLLSVGAKL